MLVRGYVDLGEGDLPWLDGIASGVTHNNLTIPVILKDTHFNIVDDWNSFEAQPSYDHDNIVAVGLYTSDYLSDGQLPVAMDNAATLADFLDHEGEILSKATIELWKEMAGWTPRPDDRRGRHVVLLRGQGPRARRGRLRPRRLVPDRRARRSASSRCSTTSTGATSSAELLGYVDAAVASRAARTR